MDISLDQQAALKAASNKLKQQAQQETGQSSVETIANSVPVTEEKPKEPVAQREPPKEQPAPVKETPQTEEPKATEQVETSWDESELTPTPTTTQPQTTYDFSKLGSALKLEGVKSEEELVAKFNELNTKLQSQSNIPEELKPVLEIAQKGGDWKSYINPVDYSKFDPVDFFEYNAKQSLKYRNPDGTFNETAWQDAMDAIPEPLKEIQGQQLIQAKIAEQQSIQYQKQQIAQAAQERRDRELSEAVKDLSKLFPVEQYGMKFKAEHSDYLYKGITDNTLLQKHFLNDDGSYNMRKVAATIAKAEWADKMIKHQHDRAKVSAKKEILQQTQNPQLNTSSTSAAPEQPKEKTVSPAEKYKKYVETQKVGSTL